MSGKRKLTHDEAMLLLLAADNNKSIPSLDHFSAEMLLAHRCGADIIPFKSWSFENERGWLYNKISAGHEHEEDVL